MARVPSDIPPPCRQRFAKLVRGPEAVIDLAEAALVIAQEEYPGLEVSRYLSCLDEMGAEVRARLGPTEDPHRLIAALSDYLFRERGFHGNSGDYYDPRNSFLNDVLDRRTGIPITLSTVYLAVGGRLGLHLHGVGMPGHFLVKHLTPDEEVVLDPFNGGAVVTPDDCQRILDRIYDGKLRFEPRFLTTLGTRRILARMLSNLKVIYFNNRAYAKALSVVDRLLILDPQAATEIRDRGLLSSQLRRFTEATADLERYLRLAPEAEDAEVIRDHLRSMRERAASLN
ncbi:MAG TPA: transglutaminase-like domain-containing protein [Candidatus Methylomirabilis sp.]|nr:transglutaminase-like domain-containing protein [Candidatus Methylomirabilis sp.]